MSNEYRHVELLTGDVRRRRWTTEQKLTIIEQSFEPGETVSSTARRHGVAPNRERDEQPTAFGVDGIAIALSFRTSVLPASA